MRYIQRGTRGLITAATAGLLLLAGGPSVQASTNGSIIAHAAGRTVTLAESGASGPSIVSQQSSRPMAALWIITRKMNVPEGGTIGDVKSAIAQELKRNGFTDVIHQDEVAGNRGDIRLSVTHLYIGGRSFYQQVIASGDNADVTRKVAQDIMRKIQAFRFL
ncbi:hypothetical protein ACIA98_34520 [Streptomyces sp. NPDC051366]|uniref:hypothetical protein n=1 Tax=Streptomyces sp. NPDC051366 TaxID=3365652 RepID=UPI0037B2D11E